jgi:hypothetical protein
MAGVAVFTLGSLLSGLAWSEAVGRRHAETRRSGCTASERNWRW